MDVPSFVRANVPLAGMTTFGIGGPARWFAEPSTGEELAAALRFAGQAGLPVKVLGGGSNLLVADSGVNAVVVKLSKEREFGELRPVEGSRTDWRVGAAASLQSLVSAAAKKGLAGLETLAGIPGCVGGAVAMNCGSATGGIGRFVVEAVAYGPEGVAVTMTPPELAFRYRGSSLAGLIAAGFLFRFSAFGDPEELLAGMREARERKKASQPLAVPSAGCVFRNPPGDSAGSLLDAAGCKGMSEGGAEVSRIHANFIVNPGGASSRDIAVLAGRMRRKVYAYAGITLEPEIVCWGEEPECDALRN